MYTLAIPTLDAMDFVACLYQDDGRLSSHITNLIVIKETACKAIVARKVRFSRELAIVG